MNKKNVFHEDNSDYVYINQVIPPCKNIEIGDYSLCRTTLFHKQLYGRDENTKLFIGKFTVIEDGVQIYLNELDTRRHSNYPFKQVKSKVVDDSVESNKTYIGNDVYIGEHVKVMPGVFIGDGAVIEPYSVVRDDIPAYFIASGNPARIHSARFSELHRHTLLKIKWWNWPITIIEDNINVLTSSDLEAIVKLSKTIEN